MLIALLVSCALLTFLCFITCVQRKEIVRLNRNVTDLVEANNRLYADRKRKTVQIKRLCHGNPELN